MDDQAQRDWDEGGPDTVAERRKAGASLTDPAWLDGVADSLRRELREAVVLRNKFFPNPGLKDRAGVDWLARYVTDQHEWLATLAAVVADLAHKVETGIDRKK